MINAVADLKRKLNISIIFPISDLEYWIPAAVPIAVPVRGPLDSCSIDLFTESMTITPPDFDFGE